MINGQGEVYKHLYKYIVLKIGFTTLSYYKERNVQYKIAYQ